MLKQEFKQAYHLSEFLLVKDPDYIRLRTEFIFLMDIIRSKLPKADADLIDIMLEIDSLAEYLQKDTYLQTGFSLGRRSWKDLREPDFKM